MKKFIKSFGKKHQKLSCSIDLGYPGTIILREAEKKNRDLIIMGTQGHSRIHYLFMGRVAYGVLRETTKDIFLVPPKK
jgi:nucleotide-binding universal stress UspA family protein